MAGTTPVMYWQRPSGNWWLTVWIGSDWSIHGVTAWRDRHLDGSVQHAFGMGGAHLQAKGASMWVIASHSTGIKTNQ